MKAAKAALEWLKTQGSGVAIFDTAGRQDLDEELLAELKKVREIVQPSETLLVADAATGQQAVSVAQKFNDAVGITGLIMTKLDGDARGGALLSMRQVTGRPVKFLGVGEKIEQLEVFHPDRMAQRILDMGDVVSLVEKAAEEIDEKEAMKLAERMQSNKFDFNDMLAQMRMMKKLTSGGGIGGLLGMLPGMSKMKDMVSNEDADRKMRHTEALILSMTPKERSRPEIINGQRRKRICLGAGRPVMEMNQLMKQFEMMKKMMKNQGAMMQMANAMMGGGGMGGMGGLGGLLGGLGGGGKMPKLPPGMKLPKF